MADKRFKSGKEEKFALVIHVEKVDGSEQEVETVAPMRWVDIEKGLLWWPNGLQVKNKKYCDPDESTWTSYRLVRIKIQGDESICVQCMELSSCSSSSENEVKKKVKGNVDFNRIQKLPEQPVRSIMDARKEKSSSNKQSSSNSGLDSFNQISRSSSPSPSRFKSSHNTRSPSRRSQSRERSSHRQSHSSPCRSRSRSRSHRSRSRSRSQSRSHQSCSALISTPKNCNGVGKKHNSAAYLKHKFPMDMGEFQKLTLTLLLENRCVHCQSAQSTNSTTEEEREVEKIDSLLEFDNLEEALSDKGQFTKLVSQLKRVGGKTVALNTKHVMERIMTSKVMAHFNMQGKARNDGKSKLKFSDKNVCEAIIASVLPHHKNATEHDIKARIAHVLKYAPDSVGGGGRGNKKKTENDNQNEAVE